MTWSRFGLAGGFESRESEWIRTVFQSLYDAATEADQEVMALYVTNADTVPATLYFSPAATRRMGAAVSRFTFAACERPASDTVELVVGVPLAWMTEWCEWPEAERAAHKEMVACEDAELDALFDPPPVDDEPEPDLFEATEDAA